MEERTANKRWTRSTGVGLFILSLLLIYFGSYYALTNPAHVVTVPSHVLSALGPGAVVPLSPDYRSRPIELGLPFADHIELSQVLDILFVPAHRLDRMLRPDVWKIVIP